jgi:CMP-N-acetylneuraminic acid synthetase
MKMLFPRKSNQSIFSCMAMGKHIHEVLTRKYKNCSKVNDSFATTTQSTTASYQDSYKGSGNTIA